MADTATLVLAEPAAPHSPAPRVRGRRRSQWPLHVILSVCAAVMVFPFVWQLLTAFKTVSESRAVPPVFLPAELDFGAFERFFATVPFGSMLGVSALALILSISACGASDDDSSSKSTTTTTEAAKADDAGAKDLEAACQPYATVQALLASTVRFHRQHAARP